MIETSRLRLRRWEARDHAPLHALCNDPRVMQFIGPAQSRAEVEAAIARQTALHDRLGYCFWALEPRAGGGLIGFCGLKPGPTGTPIADEIEIGWRLDPGHWGQGLAAEAARASLDFAWRETAAAGVAAITVAANHRSRALMERLEMRRDPGGDFDHPGVPADSPLRAHITYRIDRPN